VVRETFVVILEPMPVQLLDRLGGLAVVRLAAPA
jgi:hypothetical protein